MKNILITLLLLLVITANLCAQDYNNVRLLEFEIGMGINQGSKYMGFQAERGYHILMETRLNIRETPFSVGLQTSFATYFINNVYNYDFHIMPRMTILYVDYNYRKWEKISLFGGIGLGHAQVINRYESNDPNYWDRDSIYDYFYSLSPRIGAEFFHRLRLTIDYKIISKDYSYLGTHLGLVLGGGQRKK